MSSFERAQPVGLVVGTTAATPLQFSVAIAADQYLQLDDVVVTSRELPGQPPVRVSGVVTNVEAVHEGARFASDVFLIQQGALPAEIAEVAQVTVTRVEPEVYVPPMPGATVTRATGKQRDSALYFDEMGDQKVPVGFGRDGQPVYINFEFVDGTRGAHVSISGVSGIATKTSFALFLLHSILNSGVLAAEAHNTKMLVFSVKGEDLLFLDYANQRLTPERRKRYDELGLPAAPFQNVRVFAPPRKGDASGTPDVAARDKAVSPFYWTLQEFCEDELLPFVFADAEDERAQYTMLIGQVAARLKRDAVSTGNDGAVRISGVDPANDKIIRSFGDLVELLEAELGDDSLRGSWVAGSAVTGSINALLRRLRSAVKPLTAIIRGDLAHRGERSISTSRAQVTVVDLHNLPDRAQRFVVGVTLRGEFARKERQGTARPLMFVVLDELNKYAPREGWSPLKEVLLDIAERGRSLGLILIGAQQTASEVERRVVANSAIRVVGRLDTAEAERSE
ncbi:MAG TPA: ATP-binding protein, partial [Streptosporangiaceae bacterium]|nr:ATP-binding protein [Streptosporangiaceae bacterium]